jgi:hypothetical protein
MHAVKSRYSRQQLLLSGSSRSAVHLVLHLHLHLPHLLLVLLLQPVNVLLHAVLQLLQLLLRMLLHLPQLLHVLLLHVLRLHLRVMHSLVGCPRRKTRILKVCRECSCIAFCSSQLLAQALVLGAHELHNISTRQAGTSSGTNTCIETPAASLLAPGRLSIVSHATLTAHS